MPESQQPAQSGSSGPAAGGGPTDTPAPAGDRASFASLPLSLALLLEAVCGRFDAAWQGAATGGGGPRPEDYLAAAPEAGRPALLRELVRIDLEYRRGPGRSPDPEEYLRRFPGLDRDWLLGALAAASATTASLQQDSGTGTEDSGSIRIGPASSTPLSLPARFDDYELLEEIARGGMGVVYKARQISLNRVVALKMILDHWALTDEAVRRNGLPAPGQVADLLRAVAEAVAFAHRHGIIHRDLKPENVLIDRQGRSRVTDLGVAYQPGAAAGDRLTLTGQVIGTPLLHVARAGHDPPRGDRAGDGRLQPGRHPLLPADRAAAVQGAQRDGGAVPGHDRGAHAAASAQPAGAGGAGDRLPALPGEGPGPTLPLGGRPGGGAARRRRTNRGAGGTGLRAPFQESVAAPDAGRSRRRRPACHSGRGVAGGFSPEYSADGRPGAPPTPGTGPAPPLAVEPLEPPTKLFADFPLTVEMLRKRRGIDGTVALQPGPDGLLRLRAGDEVKFRITVARQAYVGIWAFNADGPIWQLFPNKKEQDHRFRPNEERVVPEVEMPEAEVSLGMEWILVQASAHPWDPDEGRRENLFLVFNTDRERALLVPRLRGVRPKSEEERVEAVLRYCVDP
jgi:hypothetical protein